MASLSLPPALRSRQGLAALALILGSLFLLYSHASNTSARHQLQTIQATDELRPIKGRFPSWYGNPDVVGFSPWDFDGSEAAKWDGKAGGRKKRVLFLTDYPDYLERMDTVIFELVDAAFRHPGLEVSVYGPGWAGWDAKKPVSVNIAEKWECGYWDAVWAFATLLQRDDPMMDNPGCGTLLVHQLGDCHDHTPLGSCMAEWYPYQGNITLSRYGFELTDLFTHDRISKLYPGHEMHLFAHSPDAANPWDFYPLANWNEKKRDAVLFGFEGSFYPLRTLVSRAIGDKQTFIQRHPHPGYGISQPESARTHPPSTYTIGSELYVNHIRTREDFARGMREARICVFDSSLERKMIRKYAQAMLSGCVIAADLPTEMEDELSQFIIPLSPTQSIAEINAALSAALSDPAELQRKALLGFRFARSQLTNLHKVHRVVSPYTSVTSDVDFASEASRKSRQERKGGKKEEGVVGKSGGGIVGKYERGERGYIFPYGFGMRCRSYWEGANGYRPPWCGNSYLGLEAKEEYGWHP